MLKFQVLNRRKWKQRRQKRTETVKKWRRNHRNGKSSKNAIVSSRKSRTISRKKSGHCLLFETPNHSVQSLRKNEIERNKKLSKEIYYNLNHSKRLQNIRHRIMYEENNRINDLYQKIKFFKFYNECNRTAYFGKRRRRKKKKGGLKKRLNEFGGYCVIQPWTEERKILNRVVKKKKRKKFMRLVMLCKDVLLDIFLYLRYTDYNTLSYVSKEFYVLLNSNYLWREIYCRRVILSNQEKKEILKKKSDHFFRNSPYYWKRKFIKKTRRRKRETKILPMDLKFYLLKRFNEKVEMGKIHEYFNIFDREKKGYITVQEFENYFVKTEIEEGLKEY